MGGSPSKKEKKQSAKTAHGPRPGSDRFRGNKKDRCPGFNGDRQKEPGEKKKKKRGIRISTGPPKPQFRITKKPKQIAKEGGGPC